MLIKEEFKEGVDSPEDLIKRDMSLGKYNTGSNKSNNVLFFFGGGAL